MLARKLISDSYFISGIVARDFETVSGSQVTDALDIINDIISEKSLSGEGIPYYSHLLLPLISGQEDYFVSGLIETEVVTYQLRNVRYTMIQATRNGYFNQARTLDTPSLPYTFYPEREKGGTRLYFYFLPTPNLTAEITGRFSLSELALDTELNDIFDRFYISYLKYELAYRLANFFGYPFSPEDEKTRRKLEKKINRVTGIDTSIRKTSSFPSIPNWNYAWSNLGRGYRPPS